MTDREHTVTDLPVLNDRERRRAIAALVRPEPGRYLMVADADEAVVLSIEAEVTRIGRSASADIQLEDPTVSRRHAMVVVRGDAVMLLDDRSLNGVWVNDERVAEATLEHGDVIALGSVRLRYVEVSEDRSSRFAAPRRAPVAPA